MPGQIKNRVEELIAKKRRLDPNTPTSYRDLSEVLDMNPNTVGDWINNNIKRYDGQKLAAWCDFLECDIGDLLYYEREDE
jgi:DNA-binding Xre family transcriptional regulator